MYTEITKQAFNSLLISEQVIKPTKTEHKENHCKIYYDVLGVTLLQIDNYVAFCSQYFIQDINS